LTDNNLPPAKSPRDFSPQDLKELSQRRSQVFEKITDQLKPWLLEFGNWIFGGLIGFTLIIVATLITVGPVHPAILLSMGIFAGALPLSISGLFLIKLISDLNEVAIDDVMQEAFQSADRTDVQSTLLPAPEKESATKRRTDVGLRYSVRLAVASASLTLLGVVAAFAYMAWWVALIFVVMVVLSIIIIGQALTKLMPQPTEEEKALRRKFQAQYTQDRKKRGGDK